MDPYVCVDRLRIGGATNTTRGHSLGELVVMLQCYNVIN